MRKKSYPFGSPHGIPKKYQPKVLVVDLEVNGKIVKTSDPKIVDQLRQLLGENCLLIQSI